MSRLRYRRRWGPLLPFEDAFDVDGDSDSDTGGSSGGGALLFGTGDPVTLEDILDVDLNPDVLEPESGSGGLIGALTEATELQPDELIYAVDDPSGSAASKKITLQDVLDSMVNLTSGAASASASNVTPIILDPSGTPVPRKVRLDTLYNYLTLLGATLPDGFQLRTHGGANTAIGTSAQFNGPGYWLNGLNASVISVASGSDDLNVGSQNNRYLECQTSVRFGQYPVLQFVGRWVTNANRYTVCFNNGAFDGINADLPAAAYVGFHTYYNETKWRLIIHDGSSVVLNTITTEDVDSGAADYELKIVVTNTPSIQFWIRGSMYYEETVNLPNFDTQAFWATCAVGNSSAVSVIAPKMFNVIAPYY